jgi:hypothetical protein
MINKVLITKEARFDFEEIVTGKIMPTGFYKQELEEYFKNVCPSERYFIKKFYDSDAEKMLLLFFRKGAAFRTMQLWLLAGVCAADDYNEALEERGLIKNWLDNYIVA